MVGKRSGTWTIRNKKQDNHDSAMMCDTLLVIVAVLEIATTCIRGKSRIASRTRHCPCCAYRRRLADNKPSEASRGFLPFLLYEEKELPTMTLGGEVNKRVHMQNNTEVPALTGWRGWGQSRTNTHTHKHTNTHTSAHAPLQNPNPGASDESEWAPSINSAWLILAASLLSLTCTARSTQNSAKCRQFTQHKHTHRRMHTHAHSHSNMHAGTINYPLIWFTACFFILLQEQWRRSSSSVRL